MDIEQIKVYLNFVYILLRTALPIVLFYYIIKILYQVIFLKKPLSEVFSIKLGANEFDIGSLFLSVIIAFALSAGMIFLMAFPLRDSLGSWAFALILQLPLWLLVFTLILTPIIYFTFSRIKKS
ncbi:hypothetical protein HYS94_00130 [Candidatus Daviesbacteria bacterium]|nr:hypothetical protein [Candidatus Daviesbacteria bacterium]